MTGIDEYPTENRPVTVWGILPEEIVAMFVLGTIVTLGMLLVLVSVEIVVEGIAEARELLWIGLTTLLAVSGLAMVCCVGLFVVVDLFQGN